MNKAHEQALLLLRKAQADLVLVDEVLPSPRVADEVIGFHLQQAAEKLLKALLSAADVPFPRTHNLRFLMDLLADAGQNLPTEFAEVDYLTPYGVLVRYEDVQGAKLLDRRAAASLVHALHAHVAQRVQ